MGPYTELRVGAQLFFSSLLRKVKEVRPLIRRFAWLKVAVKIRCRVDHCFDGIEN